MNVKELFQQNMDFSDMHIDKAKQILIDNLGALANIKVASFEEDYKHARDLNLTLICSRGHIGVRVRRESIKYRDFTIRAYQSGSPYPTEREKILNNEIDLYIYMWLKKDGVDYMVIDIKAMNDKHILERYTEVTKNTDDNGKTGFNTIPIPALRLNGCIIKESIRASRHIPSRKERLSGLSLG